MKMYMGHKRMMGNGLQQVKGASSPCGVSLCDEGTAFDIKICGSSFVPYSGVWYVEA